MREYYGGFAYRETVEELRLFLDLYAQVCPDDRTLADLNRTIAHSNGDWCDFDDCEHCLHQEVVRKLRYYWQRVCVLKSGILPGEVALLKIGNIHKLVTSKNIATRLSGIERQSGSTVRCLHIIRTNDQNGLKYLWLNSFAFFLHEWRANFLLPERAVEHFKSQDWIEVQRGSDGSVDVPERYQAQGFGVHPIHYPALQISHGPGYL